MKGFESEKPAGDDGVVAEAVRNGGQQLQDPVCKLVKGMWAKAVLSEDGHKAAAWPPDLCKALAKMMLGAGPTVLNQSTALAMGRG